jgi:putative ABC transport system ATP-binding protein
MIELHDVKKVFNAGRPNEYRALRGVNLTLESQKVTAICGPSGSGKTTLISIIGCMVRPTSGRVFLDSREITSLPERFLTAVRSKTFGFIFQQFNLIPGLSALHNVMLPAFPSTESYSTIKQRALRYFEQFAMVDMAHFKVQWLSGGQAQRVAIMRALINEPDYLIADEPTAHLDSKLSIELLDLLGSLAEKGKTLIITSHDPAVYGATMVNRVIEVKDGRIVSS